MSAHRIFSFFLDHLLVELFYVPNINFIIIYQPTSSGMSCRHDAALAWTEAPYERELVGCVCVEVIGRKDLTQLDKTRTWSSFVCLLLGACEPFCISA
jgi:uncharacterized membrane protein